MEINTLSDLRRAFRNGPYAWPGGYPCYFLMDDGEALSFAAAKENRRRLIESVVNKQRDGWNPIAFDINWEDGEMICCHTGKRIESAYAD